jgi:hypothetical protein
MFPPSLSLPSFRSHPLQKGRDNNKAEGDSTFSPYFTPSLLLTEIRDDTPGQVMKIGDAYVGPTKLCDFDCCDFAMFRII